MQVVLVDKVLDVALYERRVHVEQVPQLLSNLTAMMQAWAEGGGGGITVGNANERTDWKTETRITVVLTIVTAEQIRLEFCAVAKRFGEGARTDSKGWAKRDPKAKSAVLLLCTEVYRVARLCTCAAFNNAAAAASNVYSSERTI